MPRASFEENLFQERKANFFFLSAFNVPRVVLRAFNICYFILSMFLWGRYSHSYFRDKKTEAREIKWSAQGHRAGKRENQEPILGSSNSRTTDLSFASLFLNFDLQITFIRYMQGVNSGAPCHTYWMKLWKEMLGNLYFIFLKCEFFY